MARYKLKRIREVSVYVGNVSQPEFHPNGGNFTTNVMVTILSKSRDIVIHYNILDAFENILSNGTLQSHESIVLPSEPCSIIAYGEKQGMTPSSSSNSRLYAIAGILCKKYSTHNKI